MPSQIFNDGASTLYPDDSISVVQHPVPTSGGDDKTSCYYARVRKDLSADVVVIHDIALMATQRYLQTLRMNWDLRHGTRSDGGQQRPASGSSRTSSDRASRRWQPYDTPGRRQRALSDSQLDQANTPISSALTVFEKQQANPIPAPTDSLLHNIHLVCALIWRRALRDRDDVLGAEAAGSRNMAFLHECGETIVLHRAEEFEREPGACFRRVLEAGLGICRQMGDREGLGRLEGAAERVARWE